MPGQPLLGVKRVRGCTPTADASMLHVSYTSLEVPSWLYTKNANQDLSVSPQGEPGHLTRQGVPSPVSCGCFHPPPLKGGARNTISAGARSSTPRVRLSVSLRCVARKVRLAATTVAHLCKGAWAVSPLGF